MIVVHVSLNTCVENLNKHMEKKYFLCVRKFRQTQGNEYSSCCYTGGKSFIQTQTSPLPIDF